MATYDNKAWLLKNVRDAFIATDDTGLCEIVMAGEDFSKIFTNKAIEEKKHTKEKVTSQPSTSKESGTDDEDDKEIVTQFDPYPDMEDSDEDDMMYGSCIRYEEFGGHRQRSNTAQWLDKKEMALKKAAKIKVIKWEDPPQLTSDQLAEAFIKTDIKTPEKKKSLLTEQLENCPDLPHRQYLEYAKFDGTAQLGLPTKSFKIFMTMLSEIHQNYPIVVCVIANAKIKDLIGFTCYKYSIEHPEITLGTVNSYGLCLAEDDGEVDLAFPCLDNNEPCSKFGFTCLGLIELKSKVKVFTTPITDIEMNTSFQGFPKASESGNSNVNTSRQYTGGSDTSEIIRALNTVNEGNKGSGFNFGPSVTDAPQDKIYRVQLLHKMRTSTQVQLGIYLDNIEVVPLLTNKHAFWSRPKYFIHSMNSVAWCQILEEKSNKTTFRIVYSPNHDANLTDRNNTANVNLFHPNVVYKTHDFECEHDTARRIVEKVNTILDLRNSPCRREYKTAKEKKLLTRRSFHTRHLS